MEQLQNLTSNTDQLGTTEIITSVSVLKTATEDVSGNLTVRINKMYCYKSNILIVDINIFRNC